MSFAAAPGPLNLRRLIFVGLIVPAIFSIVGGYLMSRRFLGSSTEANIGAGQIMTLFVLQVALLGVLCARLIEIPWLRWFIFSWCLLWTDLNAFAASETSEMALLGESLLAGQLGLISVWAILGTRHWATGWLANLLIIPLFCSGVSFLVQTGILCLICGLLRLRGFRMALPPENGCLDFAKHNAAVSAARLSWAQFQYRDILLWTASLAVALAGARWGDSTALAAGILYAMVLAAAIWAILGTQSPWLRWPLLCLLSTICGMVMAIIDQRLNIGNFQWSLLLDWQFQTHYYWHEFASICLASSMLAASLLIFRTLGYRLLRERALPASMPVACK